VRVSAVGIKASTGWRGARWAASAIGFAGLAVIASPAAAEHGALALLCSKGPGGARFEFDVTIPSRAEAGSTYEIRIDGVSSRKISHFGLNYLHDMTVEYVLPAGASYVEGSAQFVAGTGTANVLVGRRLTYRRGVLTMLLPGKVENGTDYTPPSVRLQLRAIGAPGDWAWVSFRQYRLTANALLVGDVAVSCDPIPNPYPVGTTLITAPVAASARP
jgi:hypothetical protein